jgi:hypothetical protein
MRDRFLFISKRATRFVPRSVTRGLSLLRKFRVDGSELRVDAVRNQDFAFFTADFLAAFFALLFPLPKSGLAAR